jgi:hypothetical protein
MLTKTKALLAAAVVLGSASAALANDNDGERGGYVLPGSMDGVNPVYHPDLFGPAARQNNAGQAYGFAPAPKQTHRRARTEDR